MTTKSRILLVSGIAIAVIACLAPGFYRWVRYPNYCAYSSQLSLTFPEARKSLGRPNADTEWASSLYITAFNGDWKHLLELTEEDRTSTIGSYYHNLASAMRGCLTDDFFSYYQPFERGLFLPVNENVTPFQIGCSAEVWYQLGALTMAEHSYMLALIFSPHHESTCAFIRLAEISLIRGDDAAAEKYLYILMRQKRYRQWALDRLPGHQTDDVIQWLQYRRSLLAQEDIVHTASATRAVLRNILETNSSNKMALDYLLCYDIVTKDINAFIEDYQLSPGPIDARMYHEAVLIYLASIDQINEEACRYYAIPYDVVRDFDAFSQMYSNTGGDMSALQKSFGSTYWFYYRYARRNEK